MKEYKNFVAYVPSVTDSEYDNLPYEILFMRDAAGNDWYEIQKKLTPDTIKVVFDDAGAVAQYDSDASILYPLGFSVAIIDVEDLITDGDRPLYYSEGKVGVDYVKASEDERQNLLANANETTADWRTDLQLGSINDDDRESLIKWMLYIKELKALNFSNVSSKEEFETIKWPSI